MPTLSVPSGLRVKPPGAPTRLRITSAAAGGDTPLRLSLASTLVPVVAPASTPTRLSSPALNVPLLMFKVTVAVAHRLLFGAGRQVW
ncbi:hypothetical protein D3C87_574430 [compost metagenome]